MENFNLKKFLVENKLTTNSKMVNEETATLTMSSISPNQFEDFTANDVLAIPGESYAGNLADVIAPSLEENISTKQCGEILGMDEDEAEDLDSTAYLDAAYELVSSYERFKEAIQEGYIDGDQLVKLFRIIDL
jgi:hypothetical protein